MKLEFLAAFSSGWSVLLGIADGSVQCSNVS